MTDKTNLDNAYSLQSPDESRRLYAEWAPSYDTDFVAANGYMLHEAVADAFVTNGGQTPVLDIGAGTGIVGQALVRRGITTIDATDISPEMLAEAASKSVYDTVFQGDILRGLDRPDGHYSGIVSAGTFTLGHVGPEALGEVLRLLSPGGLAVISVRDTHYASSGFSDEIARLEPHISKKLENQTRIYAHHPDADHANDRAILLHLWKA